jgi:CubicO group peptidase (beta-lactamase class C family)
LLSLALAAMLLPHPARAAVTSVPDLIDRVARGAMTAQHLPGLVVLVAEHGQPVAVRAYGVADVAHPVPVTADTRFEIGSVTKQFTAAAILQLVEAHELSLDDTLGTYFPAYTVARAVTVRELLGQTSGIPEYLGTLKDSSEASRPTSFDGLLAHVSDKPLLFAPGTKWAYSNTNYALLGRIVEVVSHQTYAQYVREHIFAPAKMTHAGFIGDGAEPAMTARGAWLDGTTPVPSAPLDVTWATGAGAIVATAADLLAWDDALLAGTIVAPADVALMRTSGTLPSGAPTGYGFGWVIDGTPTHPRVWHNGGTFGFSAANATYPADDQIIIALTNLGFAVPVSIVGGIFAGLHPDVAAADAPAAGESAAVRARVREWIGRFQSGDIDRTQFTPQMDAAITPDAVTALRPQLTVLGQPQQLTFTGASTQPGGYTVYVYVATFAATKLRVTMTLTADRKIAGFFLKPD